MTRQTYRSLGFWLRRPNAVFQELPHGLLLWKMLPPVTLTSITAIGNKKTP